ncbi:leukocyte surface antigen CD53 [Brienomyrus brachyistius]|uniref:leukocyte surface antigen CD53 n=1 Tax=Brienomyrus brachyistius TaxID=42636 RepID=UPI0020B369E6|nr:leukocyte surface antigen CD53 [Brienomyrus brachyistius]
MSQSCLNCLKYTMCAVNFLCWLFGTIVLGFGVYLMMYSKFSSLIPTVPSMNLASGLVIIGTIVTCISFLGFLGALKENRCLLLSFFILLFILMMAELSVACLLLLHEKKIDTFIENDLNKSLKQALTNKNETNDWDKIQELFQCCGVYNATDWGDNVPHSCCSISDCKNKPPFWEKGCYTKLKDNFENNLLTIGAIVIVMCIVEVLAMCFSMTLFCHISQSGLGYK